MFAWILRTGLVGGSDWLRDGEAGSVAMRIYQAGAGTGLAGVRTKHWFRIMASVSRTKRCCQDGSATAQAFGLSMRTI